LRTPESKERHKINDFSACFNLKFPRPLAAT
jgi:hypothetical protein